MKQKNPQKHKRMEWKKETAFFLAAIYKWRQGAVKRKELFRTELGNKKTFQIKRETIMSGKGCIFLPSSAKARMTTTQIASPLCYEMLCP